MSCRVFKFSLVCFFEIITFYRQYVFWAYNGIYLIFYWSMLRIWYWCFDFLFYCYVILLLTEIMSWLYSILQLLLFNDGGRFVSCIIIRSFASAHFSTSSPSWFFSFSSVIMGGGDMGLYPSADAFFWQKKQKGKLIWYYNLWKIYLI